MNIEDIKKELLYQAALTYYDEFDIKKVQALFSEAQASFTLDK
jgi:hypothetical protein